MPVDTHIARLSRRLGLSAANDPVKIELDLDATVQPKERGALSLRLILHGRRICTARPLRGLRPERLLPVGLHLRQAAAKEGSGQRRRDPTWMTATRTRRVPSSVLQLLGQYELVDGSNQAAPVAAAGTAARAAQSCVRKSRATFSAIAMVVSIVTLDGGVGMIDASATLRLETPRTAPVASTTACGSLRGPMRTVPLAWL